MTLHSTIVKTCSVIILILMIGSWSLAEETLTQGKTYTETVPDCYLGDHKFLPTVFFPQPFIAPEFNFSLGAASTSEDITLLGNTRTLDLIAVSPIIDVQFTPFSRWAFFVNLASTMRTGINTDSAIIYGASIETRVGLGALFNALKTDNSSLSAVLTLAQPRSLAVSPLNAATQAAQEVLATGSFNSDVTTESNILIIQPGLTFAHTLSSTFGFEAFLLGNFRQTTGDVSTESQNGIFGGVFLDTQLQPALHVPIGITLGYLRNQTGSDQTNASAATLGLYENISPKYNAGLEIGTKWASGVNATTAILNTRFYY